MHKNHWRLAVLILLLCTLASAATPAQGVDSETSPIDRQDVAERQEANLTAATGLPTVGPDIPISELNNAQYLPEVAYNTKHDEYLVVWHNVWGGGGRDVYAVRLSGQGTFLSWFAVTYGTKDRAQPSVAYDPDNDRYLVVWLYDEAGDGTDWDVYGRFIPWDGHDDGSGEFPICTWSSSQWGPKVVYNQNPSWPEFLVVWLNIPPLPVKSYISARRVYADGSGFPPGDGFTVVSDGTQTHNYVNPDVAYNLARNEYLVVYSEDQVDIWATRLEANGNVLDGGEFGIAAWPGAEKVPTVAACHTEDQYFVAWQSTQSGTQPHEDIYGRFVSGDGTTGTMFHPAQRSIHEKNPSVACNPGAQHYFVVWEEQYSNLSGPYGVSGRLIHTDGTFEEDVVIVGPYTGADRTQPDVASGPPGYLVAWAHDRYGTSYQDIHGRLVWPDVVYLPLVVR
jgi:large repetitive protein